MAKSHGRSDDSDGSPPEVGAARARPRDLHQDAAAERLEQFAKSMGGWFWEMDAEYRFTYFSASVEQLTGVPPEWHYGKTRAEIGIPASITPEEWRAHTATLARREPFSDFIFERQGPQGAQWMNTSGVPVFDANGTFHGYRGTARNITARVVAEAQAARLLAAVENLGELFVLWDADDNLVTCNLRFRNVNEAVRETLVPGTPFEVHIRAAMAAGLYPEAVGNEEGWFQARAKVHREARTSFKVRRQQGMWLLIREHRLPDGSTATVCTDITELEQAERQLAAERDVFEAALRTIPDGIEVLDDSLQLVAWNDQLFEVMALDKDSILDAEAPGLALRAALEERGVRIPADGPGHISAYAQSPAPDTFQFEQRLAGGKWIECRGRPMGDGGHLAIYRDVSEARRLREELEYLASYDDLTGVLNRRRFMEVADAEFERTRRYGRPLTFIVIDIDRFKRINDTFGHQAGDEALRSVAQTCRAQLRTVDTLGRIGGEEFAVVLPEVDLLNAMTAAERVRAAIARMKLREPLDGHEVTVSIGIAEVTTPDGTAGDALARADAALYTAKRDGRNRVTTAA